MEKKKPLANSKISQASCMCINTLGYFFCLPQSINIIIGNDLFSQPLSAAKKIEALYLLWQQKAVFVLDNFHENSCCCLHGFKPSV